MAPIGAGPDTRWRHQSTTALATAVNQTGMPCVSERAHAETATHKDPSPNKWLSCQARPGDSHLVGPCGATPQRHARFEPKVSTGVVEV